MPDGSFVGTLAAVLGHAEAVRAPPLHEKLQVPVCTLVLSFRPTCGHELSFRISTFGLHLAVASFPRLREDAQREVGCGRVCGLLHREV